MAATNVNTENRTYRQLLGNEQGSLFDDNGGYA